MDEVTIFRSLARITHEIIERNGGANGLVILGIKSRGIAISKILVENLKKFGGVEVESGILDVTMFRDDYTEQQKKEKSTKSVVPCDLTDKIVVIVDDVLFTGRTARAGIEAVFSLARPKALQLAVLVDRGHREIPIRPDYVGKNIPTSIKEKVVVQMNDGEEKGVYITQQN
jgi:pyrimidine operon attenuation protein/uracil phosphoribosyltransferase